MGEPITTDYPILRELVRANLDRWTVSSVAAAYCLPIGKSLTAEEWSEILTRMDAMIDDVALPAIRRMVDRKRREAHLKVVDFGEARRRLIRRRNAEKRAAL